MSEAARAIRPNRTKIVQDAPSPGPDLAGRALLDGITVDFGPVDHLGRFFLLADAAVRRCGVTLSFGTMPELVAVNKRNSDTWRPLLPIFDQTFCTLDGSNSFVLLGRDNAGEVVATQAARLFRWPESTFAQEATSLRLFYDDVDEHRLPNEEVRITARSAWDVTGRVTYSGGVWLRPDYRGRLLTAILPRISRALAFTKWYTDYTTTIMAERIVASGVAARCGYSQVGWDLTLDQTRTGTVRCALLTMTTAEMLSDLSTFLQQFGSEVDGRVDDGAVQQPHAAA